MHFAVRFVFAYQNKRIIHVKQSFFSRNQISRCAAFFNIQKKNTYKIIQFFLLWMFEINQYISSLRLVTFDWIFLLLQTLKGWYLFSVGTHSDCRTSTGVYFDH